jgi:aminoglycoside N3'-acetyltransferase
MLVHSSLSALGWFVSGASDVIDRLSEACDTLVMPTHTYCYPDTLGVDGPIFDPTRTPSKVGLLTDLLWRRQGVCRSIHSTHSLAIQGDYRQDWCVGHYLQDSPCGEGTPYSYLVEAGASVLMLGVSFNSYTLFHTAEFAAHSEYAVEPNIVDRLRLVDERGVVRVRLSRRQGRSPMRFAEVGDLLESKGLVQRQQLGMGHLLFVPDASKVHDFLLERLKRTPDFLRRSCRSSCI